MKRVWGQTPGRLIGNGLLATVLVLSVGRKADGQAVSETVALVNGESISMKEVEDAAAEDLQSLELRKAQFERQLSRDRQSMIQNSLDKVIRGRLLVAEAQKLKVSIDELLAVQVDNTISPATDEAVARFYNSNRDQIEGSLAENAPLIREYLRSLSRQTAFDNLVTRLYRDYEVKSLVEPERTTVAVAGHPSRGPDDAPVTIVEFADFECPYCAALHPTLQKIAGDYKDHLRIVYVQFPLAGIHSHAEKAGEASLCASEQGKFWQMHDAMFADQGHLSIEELKQKASMLGLNSAEFSACLDSGKYLSEITSDLTEGMKAGVSGTPAMFINGRFLQGAVPYDDIQKIVEDELRRTHHFAVNKEH